MLVCDCEDSDVVSSRRSTQRARKQYECIECRSQIAKGDEYVRVAVLEAGYGWSEDIRCERCDDLWDSLMDLGYCSYLGGELRETYREFLDLEAFTDSEDGSRRLKSGRTTAEQFAKVFGAPIADQAMEVMG